MMDSPPCDPADPPGEGDTGLLDLPEDCLGLILDLLDPVTVAILERVSKSLHTMIQAHQYWRKALIRMVNKHPYLSHRFEIYYSCSMQKVHNKYFCKSATQYKTSAIRPRSRWEKRRRGWGRLARKRTGEHDIFFWQYSRIDIPSFQRYCQGVEHVLEEERQVQAKHPAQLPVLLSERRSTENCKFSVRIKMWGVKWGNMWEQDISDYVLDCRTYF